MAAAAAPPAFHTSAGRRSVPTALWFASALMRSKTMSSSMRTASLSCVGGRSASHAGGRGSSATVPAKSAAKCRRHRSRAACSSGAGVPSSSRTDSMAVGA
eukprot:6650946-Lingulodinium_polyedra.AAC.1